MGTDLVLVRPRPPTPSPSNRLSASNTSVDTASEESLPNRFLISSRIFGVVPTVPEEQVRSPSVSTKHETARARERLSKSAYRGLNPDKEGKEDLVGVRLKGGRTAPP